MICAGRIKSTSMVERSLIYCLKHPMRNNVVPHKRPLFTKLLLQRFRMHYCMVYPQLASSKDYFRAAIKKVGSERTGVTCVARAD